MRGAPHCDPYEAFKAYKFLGVGINYLNDNLQIFLNEEYLKSDESRTPIFTDKQNSIKDISKKLTELRRRFYAVKRDENKCVEIDEKFSKNGKFKTKIRPDIWYWTV
jgi:hypothetical protein